METTTTTNVLNWRTYESLRSEFEAFTKEKATGRRNSTGIEELDIALNGGLPKRGLGVLFSAPGLGKTTLAKQIAFSYCKVEENDAYRPVFIFCDIDELFSPVLSADYFRTCKDETKQGLYVMPELNMVDFDDSWQVEHPESCRVDYIGRQLASWLDHVKAKAQGKELKPLVIVDFTIIDLKLDLLFQGLKALALKLGVFVLCTVPASGKAYKEPLDCSHIGVIGCAGGSAYADVIIGLDVVRKKAVSHGSSNGFETTYYGEIAVRNENEKGERRQDLIIFKNNYYMNKKVKCYFFTKQGLMSFGDNKKGVSL